MSRTTLQLGRLRIDWDAHAGHHVLALDGQIDERSDLASLVAKLDGNVTFDLDGVSFINSIGVREWIKLLYGLADRGVKVTLRRCSEAVVHQLNMIIETQTGATVESFRAPYACGKCGAEASIVLDVAKHGPALSRRETPAQVCAECSGAMSFSEVAERYLLFLTLGAP